MSERSGRQTMNVTTRAPSPRRMLDGVPPDTRVVIAGVTWEFYDRFSRAVREGDNCRVAFDGKDIEMMTLGPLHERYKTRLDTFIAIVADEVRIEHQPQGSTTWKRKKVKRGVEPDSCFYFKPEKLLACAAAEAKGSNKVKDYPNPDLPSKSIYRRPRSTGPASTRHYRSPSFGASTTRPYPSSISFPPEHMWRQSEVSSYQSGPRTSRGGYSASTRAIRSLGSSGCASGFGPTSFDRGKHHVRDHAAIAAVGVRGAGSSGLGNDRRDGSPLSSDDPRVRADRGNS